MMGQTAKASSCRWTRARARPRALPLSSSATRRMPRTLSTRRTATCSTRLTSSPCASSPNSLASSTPLTSTWHLSRWSRLRGATCGSGCWTTRRGISTLFGMRRSRRCCGATPLPMRRRRTSVCMRGRSGQRRATCGPPMGPTLRRFTGQVSGCGGGRSLRRRGVSCTTMSSGLSSLLARLMWSRTHGLTARVMWRSLIRRLCGM
mmetsp:Transcript_3077/g.6099  ORF Transcript_3077/g.6099 Transcript_3077/m.6099 type:complete len:205 (+) Transcript_3077:214-828(+)